MKRPMSHASHTPDDSRCVSPIAFGADDDIAGTPYPHQQPQPHQQHPNQQQHQHQHGQHHHSVAYSGYQGPLQHQSMSTTTNSTTTTMYPASIPPQPSQALTVQTSNPSLLQNVTYPPTGFPIAHHLQQQQQQQQQQQHLHHHHQQHHHQQQQQAPQTMTTVMGSYPQAATMSVPQYGNVMAGNHGTMLAPLRQHHATKAFHGAPSERIVLESPPLAVPSKTPQHHPQANQVTEAAPSSQHLSVVPSSSCGESQESARGGNGVLAAATATNPVGYSFGQEIQELYENRRNNPGGMTAAANPILYGESETGEHPTNLSTSHEFSYSVNVGPVRWPQATSQDNGAEPRSVGARAAFSGGGPSGVPSFRESGVRGIAVDPNHGAPLVGNTSSRMTPGGLVGRFPPSYAMGYPQPISVYPSQGQVTSSHDPYFAVMMQHSIQHHHQQQHQQQQHHQQQHQQQQDGDFALTQDYDQSTMLKPMLEVQQRGPARRRKRRSSDTSSNDGDKSDRGDRALPSVATKAVQSAPARHENVLLKGVPTEAVSTADKQELTRGSLVTSQVLPQLQLMNSIPMGHSPYTYHPQHQQFHAQQSGLYQSHLLHQGSPYGLVGGHRMPIQQMHKPFAPVTSGLPQSFTHVHPSQAMSEVRTGEEASEPIEQKEKKRRTKSFPEKLMSSMMAHGVDEDAVAWLPDGKSFVVVNADEFVQQILRPSFKECKYASFVRKLHRWGFVRLTSGTGTDCFHHPLFQKGRMDLSAMLSCAPRERDGTNKGVVGEDKPPSLAGVERFIRAKAAAASAAASQKKALTSPLDRDEVRDMIEAVGASETVVSAVVPSTIEAEDEDVTNAFSSMPTVYRL